jgi:hypothetical protein
MTDIKARARELLTCDELRGRLPEEVQALLRDIVALEPVSWQSRYKVDPQPWRQISREAFFRPGSPSFERRELYDLGAQNDPA